MSLKQLNSSSNNSRIFVKLNNFRSYNNNTNLNASSHQQQTANSWQDFRHSSQNTYTNQPSKASSGMPVNNSGAMPLMSINVTTTPPKIRTHLVASHSQESFNSASNQQQPQNRAYSPKVNIFSNQRRYTGPYSVNCIMSARRFLIERLNPNSTMFHTDKMSKDDLEVLKLKLHVPSRLDGDKATLNKIRNVTSANKSVINKRFEYVNARMTGMEQPNAIENNSSKI